MFQSKPCCQGASTQAWVLFLTCCKSPLFCAQVPIYPAGTRLVKQFEISR